MYRRRRSRRSELLSIACSLLFMVAMMLLASNYRYPGEWCTEQGHYWQQQNSVCLDLDGNIVPQSTQQEGITWW